jgi:flagellar basal-body rod modification protein FlgD
MGVNPVGFNITDLIGKTDDPYSVKGTKDSLDKQAFLKLLTTQLQHQNPLEPMDNQQFVAQMAEFSALEQMQNLNKNFAAAALMQASTILGKYVEGAPLGGGNVDDLIGGIVSSIRMGEDGQISLLVGGREIDASLVKTVSEPSAANTPGMEM